MTKTVDITTIIEFEENENHFLPWDMALNDDRRVVGKSPYAGQKVFGFAPKGDTGAHVVTTLDEGWMEKAVGLVPVLIENGNMYQLTSHVVRNVRPFGA